MLNHLPHRGAGAGPVRHRHPVRLVTAGMAVVGVLALVTGGVGLLRSRPAPGDFGGTGTDARATAPATTGTPMGTGARAAPPAPGGQPTELTIPAIHVQARVRPVGTVGRTLRIPEDPAEVGWWAGSVPPAAAEGSVVLAGHVDSTAGPGALFRLTELRRDDEVLVTDATRARYAYTVTGRQVIHKGSGLPADLFAADGPRRLVIITCGGPFDRATRQYRDNIIVFAAPAMPAVSGEPE